MATLKRILILLATIISLVSAAPATHPTTSGSTKKVGPSHEARITHQLLARMAAPNTFLGQTDGEGPTTFIVKGEPGKIFVDDMGPAVPIEEESQS
ncbi:hypothetical protein DFJ77DRAFT_56383 [Powellomyces hirtus]|nr:hypothetical protein DFJ77DRAFT_56383 [Powellomyces hirtus]